MSVKQRVQVLNERLAEKLKDKGVSADGSETTTELINKVEEIQTGVDAEQYEGEYQITPSFEAQSLQTKNKLMTDDVSVSAISVVKVSNTSGGNTVIIGG